MTTKFDDLGVGAEIPTFVRTTGFAVWNRYAAVNDEFIPIHMDDEAGRAAGMEDGAFGMGNLQWAYLHNVLRDWLGTEGRIVAVDCRFRSPNRKNRVVTAHGKVTAVRTEGDERLVELDVWTDDDTGTQLASGTATVSMPL